MRGGVGAYEDYGVPDILISILVRRTTGVYRNLFHGDSDCWTGGNGAPRI